MNKSNGSINNQYSIKGRTKIIDPNYTIDPLKNNPGPADYQ